MIKQGEWQSIENEIIISLYPIILYFDIISYMEVNVYKTL